MVFNSLTFLIFLSIVLLLYYRLPFKAQNWMLLIASYVFYGWWDYRFVGLLLFTSVFDYYCALKMDKETRPGPRKAWLVSSITVNMTVLGVFKYFNFFASSLVAAFGTIGVHPSFPILHVVLPVGISFYTFLSMSYTIDVYRGELRAADDIVDFLLYVAFFPHLVAGPIVRASYLLPQCQRPRIVKADEVENGIWLILMGYIKKVVIADRLGQIVDWGFAQPSPPDGNWHSWIIVYAFAFQIYGDFAGYSDIARGLAKLMGFELVVNFRAPYLVTNPADFWKHWHISLSTWLRDYLYIPMGGNRHGRIKTYRNLMVTMFLGGLWHGAGLAYVLWGVFHGFLLCIHRWWRETFQPSKLSMAARALLVFVFFHITCLGWLLFRAGGLPHGSQWSGVKMFLAALFNFHGHQLPEFAPAVILLGGLALFFQWKNEAMDQFSKWAHPRKAFAISTALASIVVLGVFEGAQFIYFQF